MNLGFPTRAYSFARDVAKASILFCNAAYAGKRLKNSRIALSFAKRGTDMANKPIAADVRPDNEETHDEWFRRQVKQALAEADNPKTVWVPHDEVMRDWDEQRTELLAMLQAKQ